jgi:starch synthase (maltosyl-transferring)
VEDVQPQVDCGRFAVKRIVGDEVQVTAAVFGDGHDHVAARVIYRPAEEAKWRFVRMEALGNDLWSAAFTVDTIGEWQFSVEGWVDHFDTWASDLAKRIAAQPSSTDSDGGELQVGAKAVAELKRDIQLAFRTGAALLNQLSANDVGPDARKLNDFASSLRQLADHETSRYDDPVTEGLRELAERHPDLRFSTKSADFRIWVDRERARFSTWYEFFPRSVGEDGQHGTLRDAAKLIPELATKGFDVIYLPPIHPIGNAFRKGRNNNVVATPKDVGSPWAIGNEDGGHTAIAPELGGVADFDEMVRTARNSGVEIAMDIAFQCSPDHPWVKAHPEWFSIRPDGSIQYAENPPKKYQDIYPLNFESSDWPGLWEELCGVFLFWAERGVRVFRVDNPHTKALPFWEWCIAEVKSQYPDALFLAEAFTRPHVMYGLAKRGFSQSYTYFSWRNTKAELTSYLTELTTLPVHDFFRPNLWPNTPDILPELLQKGGRAAFVQRAVLAATLGSNYGIYGPAFELMDYVPVREGSEEYLDSEKYQLRAWAREREDSLMPLLQTLNQVRHLHPALQRNDTLRFHEVGNPQLLCYSKRWAEDVILVVVNLDTRYAQSGWTDLNLNELGLKYDERYTVRDLLSDGIYEWNGQHNYVLLDPEIMPAHLFHLSPPRRADEEDL